VLGTLRQRLTSSAYRRDILLQSAGNSLAQMIGVLSMPILTRIYDPAHFAAFSLFKELVAGAGILVTLRLEYLVMLPVSQQRADDLVRVIVRLSAVHLLLFTPILLFLSGSMWIPSALQPVADWSWAVPVTACAISLSVAWQQSVQKHGDFKRSAIAEVVGRIFYVASGFIGALALPNSAGLMLSMAAGALGKAIWLVRARSTLFIDAWRAPQHRIDAATKRLAASTSVSQLISIVGSAAPMLYIADAFSAAELGQYGLVVSTLFLPSSFVGQAIGQVFYQRAAESHGAGLDFRSLFWTTSLSALKIALPLFVFVALVAPAAYPIVFGSEWAQAGELAQIMTLAAAVGFVSTAVDKASLVVHAWWYLTVWHLFRSAMLILVILLAREWGLDFKSFTVAVTAVSAAAYAIDLCFSCVFSRKRRTVNV